MNDNFVFDLTCPKCKRKLTTSEIFGEYKILKCPCFEYPCVFGVCYFIRNTRAKRAVSEIKKGRSLRALKILLDVSLSLFFGTLILKYLSISKLLKLEDFIKILRFFNFDKNYSNYLIRRRNSNYFQVSSRLISRYCSKNFQLLDIGCGVGQLIGDVNKSLRCKLIVGLDKSFFSLLLAKFFYSSGNIFLVCCDLEKGLPITNLKFDLIHANDTFQYLINKKLFVRECKRLIRNDGLLALVHGHKTNVGYGIRGIDSKVVSKMLKASGFSFVRVFSDELLHFKLVINDNLFGSSKESDSKNKSDVYTILACKRRYLLKKRDKTNVNYFFISPHLDDAVLSSGFLIEKLSGLKKKVKIVTVFSEANNETKTPQAVDFLRRCGYTNGKQMFSDRRMEDTKVAKFLKVDFVHLGFIDAAWRKNDKDVPIYKNEKLQFLGRIRDDDRKLIIRVKRTVSKLLVNKRTVVLGPLGIGGHADHLIVRDVIRELPGAKVFWEDFPYNRQEGNVARYFQENTNFGEIIELEDYKNSKKKKAVMLYKSQLKSLFPINGMPEKSERYYTETSAE